MNASAKKVALLSALSKKVADGEFIVVDELKVSAPKTKEMAAFAKALNLNKTALVVMDNDDINVIRAAANLPKLETLPLAQLSTYEVVANAKVVMTKAAVEKFQEVNA
jgi:large subunit ribosomal protein L4